MRLHLRMRTYHLLWRLMPKQKIRIEGHDIEYITLPWWLLISGERAKKRFGECNRIVHEPSQTLMIFISSSEPRDQMRYTIYHEYIEGCFELKIGIAADKETLLEKLSQALEAIVADVPDFEERLAEFMDKTGDRPHVVALLLELNLAKREMGPEDYKRQVEYALKNQL